jgi:hypothetical protein
LSLGKIVTQTLSENTNWVWLYVPVIPSTWEVEGLWFEDGLGKSMRLFRKSKLNQKGLECKTQEALSSISSATKKKKSKT